MTLRPIGLLGIGYVGMLANAVFPTNRFEAPWLNPAAFACVQVVPFIVWVHVLRSDSRPTRVLAGLGLLPVVVAAACLALGCLLTPTAMERTQTIEVGHSRLVAYETNGGATTSFGMVIRQELRIVPGIVFVRELANEDPAGSVVIERISSSSFRLTFPPYGERRPYTVVRERRVPFF